jgi:translation initiation factor 2B subunit (eIF-2B alpha/beta/delta family)
MYVLTNRINRVMATTGTEPAAVESAAIAEIERARSADTRAADALQSSLEGARVGTLSRSGTVLQALQRSEPDAVLLPESRPGREGVDVAEALASTVSVTLTSDAAFPGQLAAWDADVLVVGADALFADGAVRNKVGTWPAAAVASEAEIPVVVVTAVDKISPEDSHQPEHRPGEQLYDDGASISLLNPTFERTPPELIDSYVTDRGELTPSALRSLAAEFEKRTHWPE